MCRTHTRYMLALPNSLKSNAPLPPLLLLLLLFALQTVPSSYGCMLQIQQDCLPNKAWSAKGIADPVLESANQLHSMLGRQIHICTFNICTFEKHCNSRASLPLSLSSLLQLLNSLLPLTAQFILNASLLLWRSQSSMLSIYTNSISLSQVSS